MNKKKRKANKAAVKKTAVLEIKNALVSQLTAITIELGQDSKKLKKEIEKRSAQLAKKLAKKLKAVKPANKEVTAEQTTDPTTV